MINSELFNTHLGMLMMLSKLNNGGNPTEACTQNKILKTSDTNTNASREGQCFFIAPALPRTRPNFEDHLVTSIVRILASTSWKIVAFSLVLSLFDMLCV